MSATTAAWIVLAAPLAGTIITGALFRRLPGQLAGWIGTAAIAWVPSVVRWTNCRCVRSSRLSTSSR